MKRHALTQLLVHFSCFRFKSFRSSYQERKMNQGNFKEENRTNSGHMTLLRPNKDSK